MQKLRFLLVVTMSLSLLVSACGSQQETHEDMPTPLGTSAGADQPGAWMDMTLTESRTGDNFKLSDFSGKVVILEMMDPGCSICKDQLKEISAALNVVGDKAVAVSVDVGSKGAEAQVKWADAYGATWPLAQVTKEFGQAVVSEFGGYVLHASATPVIMIDPAGTAHPTDPGIKKSAVLIELLNQWTQ
jgi:peroxiredoxin